MIEVRSRMAVFASGTGSNFSAIMNDEVLRNHVVLLVCDKPGAHVIGKAASFGIQSVVIEPNNYASKEEYETLIIKKLKQANVEWIFLAGYMRIIGETLLDAYEGRIVNIHPSLLPSFPGKDAVGQALEAGVKVSGVTIHYVDEGIDTGPIIAQEPVTVFPNDTRESLLERIQQVEHTLYPKVIEQLTRK